jgi:hypothetical protein
MMKLIIYIILLLLLLIFVRYKTLNVENFETCSCDCKKLNNDIDNMCYKEKADLKQCNLDVLNGPKNCEMEIQKQKLKLESTSLLSDGIDAQMSMSMALNNSYTNKCKSMIEIIQKENDILVERNSKLKIFKDDLSYQLGQSQNNGKTCLSNADEISLGYDNLSNNFLDITGKYKFVYNSLPEIIKNKGQIGNSLDLCIKDPPPPPAPVKVLSK